MSARLFWGGNEFSSVQLLWFGVQNFDKEADFHAVSMCVGKDGTREKDKWMCCGAWIDSIYADTLIIMIQWFL